MLASLLADDEVLLLPRVLLVTHHRGFGSWRTANEFLYVVFDRRWLRGYVTFKFIRESGLLSRDCALPIELLLVSRWLCIALLGLAGKVF